jgi:hypothetical protein
VRKITQQMKEAEGRMQEKDVKDGRDRALERYDLIAPLLDPDLEAAEKRRRRSEILARAGEDTTPLDREIP